MGEDDVPLKDVFWVGTSGKDLKTLPREVQRMMGYALHCAQAGEKHPTAKVMKGFGGAGVIEVVEDAEAGTFRAVYTVKFEDAVYVLHVFQKKSKSGIATPQADIDTIRARLKTAETFHAERKKAEDEAKGK